MPGKVHHPKKDDKVRHLFVASGIAKASDGFQFIVGRLKSKDDASKILSGTTLPTPDRNRWAIYFKVPIGGGKDWTLEVYGITLGGDGKSASAQLIDEAKCITVADGFGGPNLSWPNDGDKTGLCPSNFNPYGTYTPTSGADTLTAALSGGVAQSASFYYQDPSSGFWASQFDNFDPPSPASTSSTLTVSISGITTPTQLPGITFAAC
jgi:hypothetical protein